MKDLFTAFTPRKVWLTLVTPLRNLALSLPGPGRLPPQPNTDLRATRIVQRLLGLTS